MKHLEVRKYRNEGFPAYQCSTAADNLGKKLINLHLHAYRKSH